MCALYKVQEQAWYWVDSEGEFGPYDDYWQCLGEKFCVKGSLKHIMLTEGQLKPRMGDFIKSKGLCVFGYIDKPVVHSVLGKGFLFYNLSENKLQDFISENDVQWIAPYEWSEE